MRKFLSLMMAAFLSVGMFASTYTVAGSKAVLGSEWGETDTNNDMTLVDGVYTLVKQNVTLGAATYEYKVVKDHDWNYGANAWPSSNAQLVISEDGTYNVTFTFVEDTKAVNAVAEKTGSAVVERHYLVVGQAEVVNGDGWDENAEANKMTTADNGLTYTLTIQNLPLTKDDWYGFKIVEFGSWTEYFPKEEDGSNAYFQVPASGKYTIQYVYTVATEICQVVGQKTGELDPVEEVEERTVYFVNVPGWEAVNAYAWQTEDIKNAAWPGVAMTKTDAKVNEKDIYSYAVATNMLKIIFNNGTDQTADLTLDETKPYFYDGTWYASVEAIPAGQGGEQGGEGETTTYYLKNNWGGGDNQWTWKAMTPAENNTYKLENVVFGGQGVNYSATENADAPAWVSVDQFDGDEVGEKDTVTFVLDLAAEKKITATLVGKYVAPQGGGEGQGGQGGEQTEDNVTVYFVNALNWQNVGAHVWNDADISYKNWPGEAMTKTQNQVNSKDIYSYTFPASYTHVIFNSFVAEGAQQTSDLTVQAGKYFYLDSWYASIEDIPAPGELTYYMRTWSHTFEWAWEQMSPGENGTFVIAQTVCGGTGFHYNTIADRAGEVAAASITVAQGEQLHDYDTIAIVLNPATGAVNVTIIGHYVPDYLRVYCNAAHNDWNAYGAATTAIYLYGNYYPNYGWPGERMHAVEGEANMYYYDVDRNLYSKIIFTRVNKNDCTISDQDCAYYWGGKTGDLDIPTDEKTMYTITAYTDGQETSTQGAWSVKGGGDIPQPSTTYYLKNNWGGGDNEWTWKAMTPAENNTYKLENVIFGGVGVNYSASEDGSNSEWVPVNQFEGDEVGEKDTVTFVLDLAAAKKITATLLGKYVAPQGGEGDDPEEDAFPVVKLAGSLTSWNEPVVMVVASDSLTASLKLNLDPDHYQLKVVSDGNWLTKAGENDLYTMHRDWNHVDHLDLINTGDNIKLIADIAGEYTFTWTYADSSLVVTFPAAPEPGQKVLPVVKIAGSLTSWDEPVVMTPAADSLTASLKLNLEIDHYQLKVVSDGNWLTKAGENDLYTMHRDWNHVDHLDLINTGENIKLITDVAGEYTLTWTYADSSLVVTYPEMPESNDGYYLVGTMTSWAVVKEDQYRFSETVVPGEYVLHTTLTEGQGIKVVGVQGEQQTWYIEGEGNEYQVDAAHAGAAVIYFRPAGNTEWSDLDGHIYVAMDEQTGIQNTVSEQKVVKFIENGQLFLLINGTVYTTTGAIR